MPAVDLFEARVWSDLKKDLYNQLRTHKMIRKWVTYEQKIVQRMLMIDFCYDFNSLEQFKPYIGAGVGLSSLDITEKIIKYKKENFFNVKIPTDKTNTNEYDFLRHWNTVSNHGFERTNDLIPLVYNWSCGINYTYNEKIKLGIQFKKIFLTNIELADYVNNCKIKADSHSEACKNYTKHRYSSYISAGIQISF